MLESKRKAQLARVRKLEAEAALAEQTLEERKRPRPSWPATLKSIASFGGFVTAIVAVAGFGFAVFKYFEDSHKSQDVRIEERLDKALERLGDVNAAQRASAVVSLRSFLEETDQHARQVVTALANQLALEDSTYVRNAIVSVFRDLDEAKWSRDDLLHLLRTLVIASRGLVAEGDLWETRRRLGAPRGPNDSIESRAKSVGDAIVVLLGLLQSPFGFDEDLSGIYLVEEDLSDLSLPGVRLDDAIIARSTFHRTRLRAASFVDADLELTSFESADLRDANFSQRLIETWDKRQHNYVRNQLNRSFGAASKVAVEVDGPRFEEADLSNASFDGHALFGFSPDDQPSASRSVWRFKGANLTNTKFDHARIYGVMPADYDERPLESMTGSGWYTKDQCFNVGTFRLTSAWSGAAIHYRHSIEDLSLEFVGSNWRRARLGPIILATMLVALPTNRILYELGPAPPDAPVPPRRCGPMMPPPEPPSP